MPRASHGGYSFLANLFDVFSRSEGYDRIAFPPKGPVPTIPPPYPPMVGTGFNHSDRPPPHHRVP